MVRVWKMSGEQLVAVAAVSIEDMKDVRGLKQTLQWLYGFPVGIQKLLHKGRIMGDSSNLTELMDIHLVLLPLSTAEASEELYRAC